MTRKLLATGLTLAAAALAAPAQAEQDPHAITKGDCGGSNPQVDVFPVYQYERCRTDAPDSGPSSAAEPPAQPARPARRTRKAKRPCSKRSARNSARRCARVKRRAR